MTDANLARQARWRREWSIVTVSLALIALALGCSSWTWRLDQTFYDSALSVWRKSADHDMLIVAIDDESLRTVGRWPWKRSVHAQALKTLTASKPKAILLDLLLSEPDADPQQDEILAKALTEAAPVVLPVSFAGGPMGLGHELRPLPLFARKVTLGHADADLDPDGAMRWVYLRAGWEQAKLPHLAEALLEAGGEVIHPKMASRLTTEQQDTYTPNSWRRAQRLPIRYLGAPGTVEQVSYGALLRGEVPASLIQGRYILIGATALGLGDTHQTPVSRLDGPMASVEITAQIMQMLRTGEGLRIAPPLAVGLGSASLVLLLMAACWRLSPRRSLMLSAGLIVLLPLVSMIGIGAGLWFPPSAFVVTAVLVYPIWSWRRLEATGDFVAAELANLVQESQNGPSSWMGEATGTKVDADTDYLEHQFSAIKAVAQRLQDARHVMSHTLAGLPSAVIVTDRWGGVQHANAKALALIEHDEPVDGAKGIQQSISQRLARLQPKQAPDWAWLLDRVMQHGQSVSSEVTGDDGSHGLAGLAPLRSASGSVEGCVICLTDISDLKRAERQRDELLGFIAHDIRSPQASMISLVQLQRMTPPAMSASEAMDHVDNLARTTLNLCEELLQIMRAENRPLKRETLNIKEQIDQAVLETEPQAQAEAVMLRNVSLTDHLPATTGDASQIKRAIVNLLNNAIKFSPPHGTVTIALSTRDDHAVITVSDLGPGIPPSELSRLFKRFERIEAEEHFRLTPGIGLGLVFIETVAKRHGGKVLVQSTPGVGSSFEMWIPIAAPA
jgi:CHASE2 domain-containing sensor protein/signal transduction histidine kinase